ncbi:LysM peptidoglycan-binding domain-containing protein, partial [Deinococcus sp. RIT780]|uniref:LysM peptidoglycan-binding domain-containing protein n=1 Tax=Deinococcus sp. RIT780 TaxID=2870472 RepID=UPI001C897E1C
MRRTSLLFLILLGLTGPAGPALAASAPPTVTVRAGDTLYRIATRTGTSVAALRAANGLKGDVIRAGQVLRLSGSASVSAAAPAAATSAARRHTVKRGDTLSLIARRYGVSVSALKAGNSLSSSVIRTGQILKIPARSARPAPA